MYAVYVCFKCTLQITDIVIGFLFLAIYLIISLVQNTLKTTDEMPTAYISRLDIVMDKCWAVAEQILVFHRSNIKFVTLCIYIFIFQTLFLPPHYLASFKSLEYFAIKLLSCVTFPLILPHRVYPCVILEVMCVAGVTLYLYCLSRGNDSLLRGPIYLYYYNCEMSALYLICIQISR